MSDNPRFFLPHQPIHGVYYPKSRPRFPPRPDPTHHKESGIITAFPNSVFSLIVSYLPWQEDAAHIESIIPNHAMLAWWMATKFEMTVKKYPHPERPTITTRMYVNGVKHNDHGPAKIIERLWDNGWEEKYYCNGKLHRLDGPAIINWNYGIAWRYEVFEIYMAWRRNSERYNPNGPVDMEWLYGKHTYENYIVDGELIHILNYTVKRVSPYCYF